MAADAQYDRAEDEHGVEADRAKSQCVFYRVRHCSWREGLHQPQHLDVFAAGMFASRAWSRCRN